MNTSIRGAVALMACVAAVGGVRADRPRAPASPSAADTLLAARSLRCRFAASASAEWDGKGKPSVSKGGPPFDEPVHFDSIDAKKGTARIIANEGAGDLIVNATASGLHFLETTTFGNLIVTTVFPIYTNAQQREFVAVMSRHVDMLGTALPSQNYGACVILRE